MLCGKKRGFAYITIFICTRNEGCTETPKKRLSKVCREKTDGRRRNKKVDDRRRRGKKAKAQKHPQSPLIKKKCELQRLCQPQMHICTRRDNMWSYSKMPRHRLVEKNKQATTHTRDSFLQTHHSDGLAKQRDECTQLQQSINWIPFKRTE